jgi:GT2 family glycosyltransferase
LTKLGVVIVTYNASDVIRDCLATLLAAPQDMRVVIVDNASTDGTVKTVEMWRSGADRYVPTGLPITPSHPKTERLEVITNPANNGFAAGVNAGLQRLLPDTDIKRIWILNPDTIVPPHTPSSFAKAPGGFGLMGGRILYADPPHRIQIDGGTVCRWTGRTGNLNLGKSRDTALPPMDQVKFISGASMVASRAFLEAAGPMPETYFLYYEEVDWARRNRLPFRLCENAEVYHRAGTAIGSPTLSTQPSSLSAYYKHRARMMYLRRFHPMSLPLGFVYGLAKAGQFIAGGHRDQARATLNALHGRALLPDIAAQFSHKPVERGT